MSKVVELYMWEPVSIDEGGVAGLKLKGLNQIKAKGTEGKVTITVGPRGYVISAQGSAYQTEVPASNVRYAIVEREADIEQPARVVQQQQPRR